MGRKENNSFDSIKAKARRITTSKGLEFVFVEQMPISGSYKLDYECPKCGRGGYVVFKDVTELKTMKCQHCNSDSNEKVSSLEEINEFGVNYIDRSCDVSANYYRNRLKRIWGRLKGKDMLCGEFSQYSDFERWSLENGYKPWKSLRKIVQFDDSLDYLLSGANRVPYGMENCRWVAEQKTLDDGDRSEDTYVNRVRLMALAGSSCEEIMSRINVISNSIIEIEASTYVSKASIEEVFATSMKISELAYELQKQLDNIDIGRTRKQ